MINFYEKIYIIVMIILVAIISMTIYRSCSVGMGEIYTVTATVTDKGIKRINDEDIYLIYTKTTEEVEVFQITDNLIAGRFNSADVYAGIEINKTYKFEVRGQRSGLMSWYPNIYSYTEVIE